MGDSTRFEGPDVMKVYLGNKEVADENIKSLRALRSPINKLTAIHDSSSSKTRSDDHTENLPATLYLSVNCKVMLLRNLFTRYGLVNGACGYLKDFLYGDSRSLPEYLIIDFPNYRGPPFYTEPDRRTWVPIPKCVCKWGDRQQHFRESFPVTIAYALTVWKSQGMTITGPVLVNLGDRERDHGCSYVALSRVTSISNLCIGAGISLHRLTAAISEGKKLKERLKEDERLDLLCNQQF